METANLAPWKIDENEFPATGTAADKLRFLLRYAVLAPSGHNVQPWRFVVGNDVVDVWGDPTRRLPMADPKDREMIVSCGAALLNLRIAIQHFGYSAEIELSPEPSIRLLLARVRLGSPLHYKPDDALFNAIANRHTNRGDFQYRHVPAAALARLEAAAKFEGANLLIIESDRLRATIAGLIEESDHVQARDKQYRSELAGWLRPNKTERKDGLPGYALGLNALSSLLAPAMVRTFEMDQAEVDRRQILETPELAVLWTEGDTPLDWLSAGQALGRVLLCAYADGLQASFFTQVLEVDSTRSELHRVLALTGSAQMILRLGFGETAAKPTPRRPADEVTD